MKPHLKLDLLAAAVALCLTCAGIVSADDTSTDTQASATPGSDSPQMGAGHGAFLSSLSSEDKMKFMKARRQALENNPDLKTELEDLTKQREAIKSEGSSATPEEKHMLLQNFMAHQKKMEAAMLQVDPTLQPIFDQIDAKMKEKFAQHQGEGGN